MYYTLFFKIDAMRKDFFTSKEVAQITGCTLRQLQYWREKGVVVPTISATGTGRSIYYSHSELIELGIMEYCLAMGVRFDVASWILEQLREAQWDYLNPETTEKLMLHWKRDFTDFKIELFDSDRAIALLNENRLVTPFSFHQIHFSIKTRVNQTRNQGVKTLGEIIEEKLELAGWKISPHDFIKGDSLVRDKSSKKPQLIDYILLYENQVPIAVIEAKRKYRNPDKGLSEAIKKANQVGVKFAYSSNGKFVVEYDLTTSLQSEAMNNFPTPKELWHRLTVGSETPQLREKFLHDYQKAAIRTALINILQQEKRLLLNLATESGKTQVALRICWYLFQIYWNLKEEKRPPKILFLAYRQIDLAHLMSQAINFFPREQMAQIQGKVIKGQELYFTTTDDLKCDPSLPNLYQAYNRDYFDLILVDECEDQDMRVWREIAEYFTSASQIGLAIAASADHLAAVQDYFGAPIYQYSREQGMAEGVIAPYQIHLVQARSDLENWQAMQNSPFSSPVPPEVYQSHEWQQKLVSESRTTAIAQHISEFLQAQDNPGKTLVICANEEHVKKMVEKLQLFNRQQLASHGDYIVPLTECNEEKLTQFQNLEPTTPIIGIISAQMETGIDCNCQTLFIASAVSSPENMFQIVGRSSRVVKQSETLSLSNLVDYTNSTALLREDDFDGELAISNFSEIND
jgi:type I restriction enzyme R subunit